MTPSDTFLNLQRTKADPGADTLINTVFSNNQQKDLYTFLNLSAKEIEFSDKSSDVRKFLVTKRKRPGWYSKQRILKGQEVFNEYASEIMALLGVMALPYCYAGSPGNKALYFSEKMRNSPGKRLADTAEFIIAVSTPGNLTSSSTGQFSINKTRLIHAIARYHVSKGDWKSEWGSPINQEDMAGTNLAFSYIILNGLRLSGFTLTENQKDDFIYLWRYIGYQIGIHEELLPANYAEAFRLKQKIVQRNFKKSKEGIELTSELLKYYRSLAPPNQSGFIDSQVRYYLGDKIAGYLDIEQDNFKDRVTGYLNSFKELQNFFSVHKNSFGQMVSNHRKIKQKIKLSGNK